ncbi:MAG: phosphoribosyltransferase family protein [Flavobacteriales bacterium]
MSKTKVLEQHQIEQKIVRMAWEIYEKNNTEKNIVIAGIHSQGYILAKRLSENLKNICNLNISLVKLEIDKNDPLNNNVQIDNNESLTGKNIVLVDDVLNSGKTLIYSCQYFLNQNVKKLMTAVLINRNYRKFPIKADVVGVSLSTTMQEHVTVDLGKNESVYLQ